jgi:predicted Zn-dependent protease
VPNIGYFHPEIVHFVIAAYSGGVGIRSGDSTDVNRMVLAAMYDRAQLFRTQKNAAGAADAFATLAAQFPADQTIRLLAVESLIQDKKDYAGALAALQRMPAPADSDRTRTRYETDRADAFAGNGQPDSARVILTDLAKRFPANKRIQDKLARLK